MEITTNPAIIGVNTAISNKLKVFSSFLISSLKLLDIDLNFLYKQVN